MYSQNSRRRVVDDGFSRKGAERTPKRSLRMEATPFEIIARGGGGGGGGGYQQKINMRFRARLDLSQ